MTLSSSGSLASGRVAHDLERPAAESARVAAIGDPGHGADERLDGPAGAQIALHQTAGGTAVTPAHEVYEVAVRFIHGRRHDTAGWKKR